MLSDADLPGRGLRRDSRAGRPILFEVARSTSRESITQRPRVHVGGKLRLRVLLQDSSPACARPTTTAGF